LPPVVATFVARRAKSAHHSGHIVRLQFRDCHLSLLYNVLPTYTSSKVQTKADSCTSRCPTVLKDFLFISCCRSAQAASYHTLHNKNQAAAASPPDDGQLQRSICGLAAVYSLYFVNVDALSTDLISSTSIARLHIRPGTAAFR